MPIFFKRFVRLREKLVFSVFKKNAHKKALLYSISVRARRIFGIMTSSEARYRIPDIRKRRMSMRYLLRTPIGGDLRCEYAMSNL